MTDFKKLLVFCMFLLSAPQAFAARQEVKLEYRPQGNVGTVYLTGDFADWNPTAYKMTYYEAEDVYRIKMKFDEGRYLYKFVVNGKDWKYDVSNPDKIGDGHGGYNSVLKVGEAYRLNFNEKKGDGKIMKEAVKFATDDMKYFDPYADGRIRFILRAAAHDIDGATLYIDGAGKKSYRMTDYYSDGKFDYFLVYVTSAGNDIKYCFALKDAGSLEYYGPNGFKATRASASDFSGSGVFKNYFKVPRWAQNVVWYQIMVDRFRNGSTANDPAFDVLPFSWNWFTPTEKEKKKGFYSAVWDRKFGGDLIGGRDELPYLEKLGVTAIYFNPVFKSESYQKYNTEDFRHIDDTFYEKGDIFKQKGETDDPVTWSFTPTDKYFFDFVKAAHSGGMKVIIDGVFNHSGTEMFAFNDLRMKKKNSKYADWYKVQSWEPFKYIGWAGFGSLPEFNQDEYGLVSPVRDFIFNITRRWQNPGEGMTGIDGWRLDVPMCVKKPFWQKWRGVVKEANPEAVTIGEIWTDATDWLKGDAFDAVMNYEFAKLLVRYFIDVKTKIAASEFDRRVRELAVRYPQQVTFAQYNLTNSHDTDRIVSMIKNPDREYNTKNRLQNPDGRNYDNSPPSGNDYRILKLIRTFQFAFPGAPAIYYGDEAGMWGADDPNNRKPMWWSDIKYENKNYKINKNLEKFMRRLIAARNTYPSMRTGVLYPVLADDGRNVVVYRRELDGEKVFVVINNSDKKRTVMLDTKEPLWNVLYGGGEVKSVTEDDYAKNGPSGSAGRQVFMSPLAKVNCVSIKGKPDYRPHGGRVKVVIKAKTGLYLANRAYAF